MGSESKSKMLYVMIYFLFYYIQCHIDRSKLLEVNQLLIAMFLFPCLILLFASFFISDNV